MTIVALPASMKAWMVNNGMTTEADADRLGLGVLDGLEVTQQVMLYGMYNAAVQEDALTAQKNDMALTVAQINNNNASIANIKAREAIGISLSWPTDAAAQTALAQLLRNDIGVPMPPPIDPNAPADPGNPVTAASLQATAAAIQKSKDSVDRITQALQASTADPADTSTWPTDPALQQAMTDWLGAQGLPASSIRKDTIQANGATANPSTFETVWPPRLDEGALVVSTDDSSTGVPYFVRNGIYDHALLLSPSGVTPPPGLVPILVTTALTLPGNPPNDAVFASYSDLKNLGVNMSLWPPAASKTDGTKAVGQLWVDSVDKSIHFVPLAPWQNYPFDVPRYVQQPIVPRTVGGPAGSATYFSDGTHYYKVDYDALHDDTFIENNISTVNAATKAGTPWTAFIGHGLTEVPPPWVGNPPSAEVADWKNAFEGQLTTLTTYNNTLGAQAQNQQIMVQEAISKYGTANDWMSNAVQRRERTFGNVITNL